MKKISAIEAAKLLGVNSSNVSVVTTGDTVNVIVSGADTPVECSLWSLRCQVKRRGLDAAIDAGIAALALNQQTAAWAQWSYAGDKLSRSDVLIKQIKGWIGYNERQMDSLFAAAIAVETIR